MSRTKLECVTGFHLKAGRIFTVTFDGGDPRVEVHWQPALAAQFYRA